MLPSVFCVSLQCEWIRGRWLQDGTCLSSSPCRSLHIPKKGNPAMLFWLQREVHRVAGFPSDAFCVDIPTFSRTSHLCFPSSSTSRYCSRTSHWRTSCRRWNCCSAKTKWSWKDSDRSGQFVGLIREKLSLAHYIVRTRTAGDGCRRLENFQKAPARVTMGDERFHAPNNYNL